MTTLFQSNLDSPNYSPLPVTGSFIRLLDILPGHHETLLECNLRVASLRSQLSYKAVSYSWIDETVETSTQKGGMIICDGKPIMISNNLHSALQMFRSSTSILTLWVDFLCINQQDTEERNRQVGMMRSIYSNSSEVLIWLGPNVVDDHLGDRVVARQGMDNKYKVVWHNDNRDQQMVLSYLQLFREYERVGERGFTIPWARDVFGAFIILKQLAQGIPLKVLRFYQAIFTSVEQIRWSSSVHWGIGAVADCSWWKRTWVI
ncbi:hypothetical protein DM02DRAFT_554192 [Periconia macrospinosa]|uniref:Heterokaryon incompatibility domain-containing protein n=1 Tax=Periconia macrospinosa TaxID=97972 RepID=A0A2V1E5K3_9PLEO|nr:hypothetical protein DM02DRAFT_554192 [Periconia macrospinosa]